MRAVLIKNGKGSANDLYIGETTNPSLKHGQVLVKVKAFGLNRSDIMQRQGRYPPPPGASEILGLEFSGIVEEVGADVSKWKVGNEVLGLASGGAYAEYIVSDARLLFHKPHHLSFVEAASVPEVYLTAFQTLLFGEKPLQIGQDVLIHAGASGVGLAAIQLSRMYGAKTVTATASSKEKLDMLLSLPDNTNATHVANYKSQDFAEEVLKTTNGKGVDIIVDFVGSSHWVQNIKSLARDGRMTMLSFLSGNMVEKVDLGPILFKRLTIQGSTLRSRSIEYQAELVARFDKECVEQVTNSSGSGRLRTYIHKVFPWTEITAAHQEMEADKNIGKIIAEIN